MSRKWFALSCSEKNYRAVKVDDIWSFKVFWAVYKVMIMRESSVAEEDMSNCFLPTYCIFLWYE